MPKKVLVGTVVSDKMDKTVVVAVERRVAPHVMRSRLSKQPSSKHMMPPMLAKLETK